MKKILVITLIAISNLFFGQIDTLTSLGDKAIFVGLNEKNYPDVNRQILELENRISILKYEQLELSGDFDSIPYFIFKFCNLSEIIINSTRKIKLSKNFNKLKELNSIRISSQVIDISDSIILPKINSLYMERYTSSKFPTVICKWKELIEINIQSGSFTYLPNDILNLKKLKIINMSNNKIKKLPDEIGILSNIEILSLEKNCLKDLPSSICELKNLKELYLSQNRSIKVSSKQLECIKSLPNFKSLYK